MHHQVHVWSIERRYVNQNRGGLGVFALKSMNKALLGSGFGTFLINQNYNGGNCKDLGHHPKRLAF